MKRVEGKVIIVTGAASGLGLADSKSLIAEGATVIMTDIDAEKGRPLANELGGIFFNQDVSDESTWSELMKFVENKFGRLDGLVNNAGIAPIASIEEATTQSWREVMNIHLDGTFWGCQSAIKLMKINGGGSIVNMSSTAALIGLGSYVAYSAAKGGIRSMSKSIAIHCRQNKLNIRCNSVHPGYIETEMIGGLLANREAMSNRLAITPLGIFATAHDVALSVLYLASDESRYVTGSELVIDGGITAQ